MKRVAADSARRELVKVAIVANVPVVRSRFADMNYG